MNTEPTTGKWLLKFLRSNVKMSNVYNAVFLRNIIYWANFIFSRFTRLKVNFFPLNLLIIISKVYLSLLFLILLFLQLYFFKSLFFVHLKKNKKLFWKYCIFFFWRRRCQLHLLASNVILDTFLYASLWCNQLLFFHPVICEWWKASTEKEITSSF